MDVNTHGLIALTHGCTFLQNTRGNFLENFLYRGMLTPSSLCGPSKFFISLGLPSRFEIFEAGMLRKVKNPEGLNSGTSPYAKVWQIFLGFEMTNKKTHETLKIQT
jgi:hypothetical protein